MDVSLSDLIVLYKGMIGNKLSSVLRFNSRIGETDAPAESIVMDTLY